MTLAVYPLVYLPVAASLRSADPGQEEVARSLGVGRLATFWRVTLGQARGAILGGCLLVALVMLAEYGAFEILGYQTFTTEIFTEFSICFDSRPRARCRSCWSCSAWSCSAARAARARRGRRQPLRRRSPSGSPGATGSAGPRCRCSLGLRRRSSRLALGVPSASAIYWMFEGGARRPDRGLARSTRAWHTALYSACAAASSRR